MQMNANISSILPSLTFIVFMMSPISSFNITVSFHFLVSISLWVSIFQFQYHSEVPFSSFNITMSFQCPVSISLWVSNFYFQYHWVNTDIPLTESFSLDLVSSLRILLKKISSPSSSPSFLALAWALEKNCGVISMPSMISNRYFMMMKNVIFR